MRAANHLHFDVLDENLAEMRNPLSSAICLKHQIARVQAEGQTFEALRLSEHLWNSWPVTDTGRSRLHPNYLALETK